MKIWDLNQGDCGSQDCIEYLSCCSPIGVFIPGLPGPPGNEAIVDESTSIVVPQTYTIVNSETETIQTLPPLNTVLSGTSAIPITVVNATANTVTIIASGEEIINYPSPVTLPFINTSYTFLPTSLGWFVI